MHAGSPHSVAKQAFGRVTQQKARNTCSHMGARGLHLCLHHVLLCECMHVYIHVLLVQKAYEMKETFRV